MSEATVKKNPKMEGMKLWDCVPQEGKCPIGCNQCFFNRAGAYYTDTPTIPTPEEVGDDIVRMNCGNDSNINRALVIETAKRYKHAFFNTSVRGKLDFPGPVVLTANPKEEEQPWLPNFADEVPRNLMFIRLRMSSTNIHYIDQAVRWWTSDGIPVVLTFMSYYDHEPVVLGGVEGGGRRPVLRVEGPAYQLLLVPDEGLHALRDEALCGQPAGEHVRQH